jgi:hypothetical protein
MDDLISTLKERYEATTSKIGRDFIYGICFYLDLFSHPEIQAILENQKQLPNDHYHRFLRSYQKLLTKVYEPIQKRPDLAEWKFYGFWMLNEDYKGWKKIYIIPAFPCWKAYFWDRYMYTSRLTVIHTTLLVLLKNKQLLIPPAKPVVKRFLFNADKSILYLNEFEVPINRHGSITDQHRILAFIFKHDNLRQEFFYAEMAEEVFGEPYDSQPRRYWDNCELINEKVANDTKGRYPKLLIATLEKKGLVKINPDCWELFR